MTDKQSGTTMQDYTIERHTIAITMFHNFAAKTCEVWDMTLHEIAEMVVRENRIRKNLLPWIKLAEFGGTMTAKGSLRHDANVLTISGVENEHDSGRMSFDEAAALMRAAGIRCMIYTSPSHLVDDNTGEPPKEKWRILTPTSEPRPATERYKLAARVNGILKGASTAESFVLSQSYYFGSVDHNPAHHVEVIDGDFVDLADDLDAGAIGAPAKVKKRRKASAAQDDTATPGYTDDDISKLISTACELTANGDKQWHHNIRSATSSLVGKMKTDAEIHELCSAAYIDGWGRDDAQKLIDGAREKWSIPDPESGAAEFEELLAGFAEEVKASGAEIKKGKPKGRPVIRYGKLDEMVDQAMQALIDAEEPFYQRGGMLVRPTVLEVQSFNNEPTFATRLVEVNSHYMADTLSRIAEWVKWNKTENRWVPANPPMSVCLVVLAKFGDWPFRVLAGLITTQTLRPDGSILATPGYDPATQLLLIDPPAMKEIPEKPTYEDAREALAVLKDMLSEFPFVDAGGDSCTARAVALSAIVSTVCRGAYPVVPMHAIDAPAAGTGKSYLLSTVSLISTGQPMPVMSAGKTVEETEKRLGAAVIAGQTLICIDNVEGELGGDALCQLIEQVRPNVRILGQSKLIEVDGRSMSIFANGNNFTLVGDVYRRVVTGRLDAGVDRPEKRQFTKDPAALILADRGKYVAACLVICRAYQVAGRPGKKPQIGSFNGWSDTVRSALAWLGEADCVETMDDARAEDPHRQAQEALLTAWRNTFGKRPMLLRDVVVKCDERTAGMRIEGAMPYTYPELRAAVQGTNPEAHRMSINVNALGQKMRHYKDQWINGMRFTKQERSGEVLWCAEATERPTLRTKATTKKPE